ncbi:MAG TPA: hypothetical protein DIW52_21155 [Pseudomonas sp.]|nr:hypothetical protein [Pseudomonas sp.]
MLPDDTGKLAEITTYPDSIRPNQLPQVIGAHTNPVTGKDPMWERACSRMRTDIRHRCRLTCPLREQARSHILNCMRTREPGRPVDRGGLCLLLHPKKNPDQSTDRGLLLPRPA